MALVDLSDLDLAKVLGAVDVSDRGVTIRLAGLLLFGREEALRRFVPTHEVAWQELTGTSVAANSFYRWPLLRVAEQFFTLFRAKNREKEIRVGLVRVPVPDYPEAAFREGLANALVHRDYGALGAIHVQWRQEEIEIGNPGGFPEGVRLDNLLVTQPRPRNLLLADAFKRAGVVERSARGVDLIFETQLRAGRPAPSYEGSDAWSVVLRLRGGQANLAFVRLIVEEEQRTGRSLRLDDLLLLNGLWEWRRLTTPEAARLIQKSDEATRACFERLVEAGLVEGRGERKGRVYLLSAAVYRRLGDPAGAVRSQGFEALQHEQMVLKYARSHGRITRREAAALCQITDRQASRLLRHLVDAGSLLVRGERRWTFYEPRS